MSLDFEAMLLSAKTHLAQARTVADACRHREALHELHMRSVFLMEDIVFLLHEMAVLQHEPRREGADVPIVPGAATRSAGGSLADDRL